MYVMAPKRLFWRPAGLWLDKLLQKISLVLSSNVVQNNIWGEGDISGIKKTLSKRARAVLIKIRFKL